MIFMHLNECPYCARMVEEIFDGGDFTDLIKQRFDVVALNVRGDLEVAWIDGEIYTERQLDKKLGVIATPTVVFLDQQGGKVLQLTGYRDPVAMRLATEYVHGKFYLKKDFRQSLASLVQPEVYEFRDHRQFEMVTFFKDYNQPLAILFEDKYCSECARFHDTTLNHPEVLEALKPFLVVRLNATSRQLLITPSGHRTTPAEWVNSLGLTYRPALILFNRGKEVFRADGRLYHQHLLEALTYVSGENDKKYSNVSAFRRASREERLNQGKNVDFSE